jgi:hypothetical protein
LITAIVCLAVLTSGCTININTDSDDKQTTNEEKQTVTDTEQTVTSAEQTEVTNKRTQAPQASIRGSGNTLEHQGGEAINLAHVNLIINGESFDPLCTDTVIFGPGDVITVDKSGYFLLNGDPIKTAKTHNLTSMSGNIKMVDIPSGQMIADLRIN